MAASRCRPRRLPSGALDIQNMGYYPFGSYLFSNLVHYVRTGDCVMELLAESQNADEYAFAPAPWRITPRSPEHSQGPKHTLSRRCLNDQRRLSLG